MDSIDIEQFFTRLTRAFISSDLNAMRLLHTEKASFSSPDTILLANSDQEFNDVFSQGAALIQQENISGITVSNGQWQQLSDNIVIASLDWRLFDQANNLFTEFRAIYHLTNTNGQFKICSTQSVEMHANLSMAHRFTISQE